MKRILVLCFISSLFTGCASSPRQSTDDIAVSVRQTCINAGFAPGSQQFGSCFLQLMQGAVERESKPTFLQQYMLNRAANPGLYQNSSPLPVTTQCSRTGSYINCETSRF